MMKWRNIFYFGLLAVALIIALKIASAEESSSSINWLSKPYADSLYVSKDAVQMPYAHLSSNVTQNAVSANARLIVNFSTVEDAYGISLDTIKGENITFNHSGNYLVILSAIFTTSVANKHAEIWVQKINSTNGFNDVIRSNTKQEFATVNTEQVVAVSFILDFQAGEKMRIAWASDTTGTSMIYTAATSYSPATPSIIMSISKVNESMQSVTNIYNTTTTTATINRTNIFFRNESGIVTGKTNFTNKTTIISDGNNDALQVYGVADGGYFTYGYIKGISKKTNQTMFIFGDDGTGSYSSFGVAGNSSNPASSGIYVAEFDYLDSAKSGSDKRTVTLRSERVSADIYKYIGLTTYSSTFYYMYEMFYDHIYFPNYVETDEYFQAQSQAGITDIESYSLCINTCQNSPSYDCDSYDSDQSGCEAQAPYCLWSDPDCYQESCGTFTDKSTCNTAGCNWLCSGTYCDVQIYGGIKTGCNAQT